MKNSLPISFNTQKPNENNWSHPWLEKAGNMEALLGKWRMPLPGMIYGVIASINFVGEM